MLLLIVNVILLIAGMFLDSTTATLLVIPIIAGPLHMAGVDPVHLGIVAIFNLMIGLLTPPMGLALFLITDIAKVSMRSSAAGAAAVLRSRSSRRWPSSPSSPKCRSGFPKMMR